MAKEYKVGYRKPPKSGQFKPGVSGNPRGRKPGRRGLRNVLKDELCEPIAVSQAGKKKTITKQEALIKSLMRDALNGNAKAASMILKLVAQILPLDDEPDEILTPTKSQKQKESLAFFQEIADRIHSEQVVYVRSDGRTEDDE
jgi:hypothetical protein